MFNSFILFAEDVVQEEAKKGPTDVAFWQNPIFLLPVMFALFYFVVLRPQQRRMRKEQDDLMANLKKNDEVVTSSGIIGIVSHIKESGDEVTLKIDDNARLRVLRSTIVRIVKKDIPTKEGAAPAVDTNIKPG